MPRLAEFRLVEQQLTELEVFKNYFSLKKPQAIASTESTPLATNP